jgi:hypothetical protein
MSNKSYEVDCYIYFHILYSIIFALFRRSLKMVLVVYRAWWYSWMSERQPRRLSVLSASHLVSCGGEVVSMLVVGVVWHTGGLASSSSLERPMFAHSRALMTSSLRLWQEVTLFWLGGVVWVVWALPYCISFSLVFH